jgi:hypothetical protein
MPPLAPAFGAIDLSTFDMLFICSMLGLVAMNSSAFSFFIAEKSSLVASSSFFADSSCSAYSFSAIYTDDCIIAG